MEGIPARELASALGIPCEDDTEIRLISTDSRELAEGCVFVCIAGERFDGHDYAEQAVRQGAKYLVAEKPVPVPPERVWKVPSTLDANILLAGAYRKRFHPLAVGITGSVGKTTTKEFTAAVLSRKFRTLKNEGNQNNEIGLPKTLLRLNASHEALVAEMGMNAPGDIRKLTGAVQPDIGVVTWIGTSHIGLLGSRENILRAKLEIAESMKPGAPLILCVDNDLLSQAELEQVRVVGYGIENSRAEFRADCIREADGGTTFTICYRGKRAEAFLPVSGRHHVLDALAAFAVGIEAGVCPEDAVRGLAEYQPSGMRQRITRRGGITVVEDCYNASPDSMTAALETLRTMAVPGRRYAVLGDMLELGDYAEQAHREVGRACADAGIDGLLCVGEQSAAMADEAGKRGLRMAEHYPDKGVLTVRLKELPKPGDALWFKASRGIRLETVIEEVFGEEQE